MQSYKGRFDPTRFQDLTVTIDFRCHSACRFCIVQEGMNYFKGLPFETFKKAVDDNSSAPRYRRLIFTGGEVTLEKRLFEYVAYARASGSFDHIRIQTNGRLLADRAFAKRLVDAGIDEYFVSLHGPTPEIQDYISQRPGSFEQALAGMRNVVDLGATLLTNSVLSTLNCDHLPGLVDAVKHLKPERMEFWYYLPMEDFADQRDLLPPMTRLMPPLKETLARAKAAGIEPVVKYVPQCLMGEHAECLDNSQGDVVIVEAFYDVYPQFNCLYEAKCEHAETCLGLHHPYINRFGWEEHLLEPVPRTRPWREFEYGPAADPEAVGGARPVTHHPEWLALVEGVAESEGARLGDLLLNRRQCIFHFEVEAGSADLVLTARDDTQPALVRSRSFNLHYRDVQGDAREHLSRLIKAAAEAVVARDAGGMHLDPRKGLVGPEQFRPRRGDRATGGDR